MLSSFFSYNDFRKCMSNWFYFLFDGSCFSPFITKFIRKCRSREDHDDGDNKTVQTQGFSENEDKDHSNEDLLGLGVGSHACVSRNTNGQPGSERTQTASQSCSKLDEAIFRGQRSTLDLVELNNGDNESVNTQDTSHDKRNQTLENLTRVDNREGSDTHSGLGDSVGWSEVGENQGGCYAHICEEIWGFVCKKCVN